MAALGARASRRTAFRKLKDIDARTSYSQRLGPESASRCVAIRLFKVDLGKRPIRPPYVNFRLADTDIMQFGGKKAQMKRSHWTAEEQKRHMGSAMAIATTANLLLGLRWTDIGRDYVEKRREDNTRSTWHHERNENSRSSHRSSPERF